MPGAVDTRKEFLYVVKKKQSSSTPSHSSVSVACGLESIRLWANNCSTTLRYRIVKAYMRWPGIKGLVTPCLQRHSSGFCRQFLQTFLISHKLGFHLHSSPFQCFFMHLLIDFFYAFQTRKKWDVQFFFVVRARTDWVGVNGAQNLILEPNIIGIHRGAVPGTNGSGLYMFQTQCEQAFMTLLSHEGVRAGSQQEECISKRLARSSAFLERCSLICRAVQPAMWGCWL